MVVELLEQRRYWQSSNVTLFVDAWLWTAFDAIRQQLLSDSVVSFLGCGEVGEFSEPMTAHALPDASNAVIEARRQRRDGTKIPIHLRGLSIHALDGHVFTAVQRSSKRTVVRCSLLQTDISCKHTSSDKRQ